jgi:hypothetical protein
LFINGTNIYQYLNRGTFAKPIAVIEAMVGPASLVLCIVARWGVLIYNRSDQQLLLVESLFVALFIYLLRVFCRLYFLSRIIEIALDFVIGQRWSAPLIVAWGRCSTM